MAVDSDEEVDYSKMDQVWSWEDGGGLVGSYSLVPPPFPTPRNSVPHLLVCPHLPSAAVMGSVALWGHHSLTVLKCTKSNEIAPKIYFSLFPTKCQAFISMVGSKQAFSA